jgi:folylpolyglutamate synthase/dihydropteroate synthase
VIATRADNPRSASPEEIRNASVRAQAEIVLVADVASAIERARKLALSDRNARPTQTGQSDAVVVITGSIYVVGEAMRTLGVGADGK